MNRWRCGLSLLAVGLMLGCGLDPAQAKTLALLVGVAQYEEDSGIHALRGPRNDVTIMWRMLKSRGADPKDITVLTDGLPTDPQFPPMKARPFYKNVIAELDRLGQLAAPDDTVVFYYSGHGITQPAADPDSQIEPEADGQDQVLLPADAGAYDPLEDSIKNGLVDNELGAKLAAIQAKGAFVWAIVDACHSGTVTRGTDVVRTVDPAILHVPQTARTGTRGGKRFGALSSDKSGGRLVGFYAVDSYDEAIERPFPGYDLPMTGDGETQRMGVFTYHLHRALARGDALTYRDLAQEIVADVSADRSGGRVPPPVFDGDLDQPLVGASSDGAARMLAVLKDGKLSIPAGTLHGFEPGARIAIYAKPGDKQPVAHASIADATAATSTAGSIKWEPGTDPVDTGALAVVVSEPAVTFRFAVAPPPPADLAGQSDIVVRAIDTALGAQSESGKIGIELAAAGDPQADLQLRAAKGRLWIVRPERPWVTEPGSFDETPSIEVGGDPETLAKTLKDSVWRLARATKLIRVAGTASESSADQGPGIEIAANVYRAGDKGEDARKTCAPKGDTSLPKIGLSPLLPFAAANCDYVEVTVSNPSDYTYYVGGFYVDALGGVAPLIPKDVERGCVRKLPTGAASPITYKFKINTWDTEKNRPAATGVEDAVFLAIPEDQTKIAPRLCSLVQPTLDLTQATRSADAGMRGSGGALKSLLEGVTGSATRSVSIASDEESGPKMAAKLFVFDLRP